MAVINGYDGFDLEAVSTSTASSPSCICSTPLAAGVSSFSGLFLVAYIVTVLFMMMLLAVTTFLFYKKKIDYATLKNITHRLFLAMWTLLGNAMPSLGGYKFAWRIIEPAFLDVMDQILSEKVADEQKNEGEEDISELLLFK
uniref:G_PROTEIN_RECEP_F1_2 domain-containing protein n=1 Tax=Strongyloides papillosus TaxID=174720 RepID=A0A0N5CB66_STREA